MLPELFWKDTRLPPAPGVAPPLMSSVGVEELAADCTNKPVFAAPELTTLSWPLSVIVLTPMNVLLSYSKLDEFSVLPLLNLAT